MGAGKRRASRHTLDTALVSARDMRPSSHACRARSLGKLALYRVHTVLLAALPRRNRVPQLLKPAGRPSTRMYS